MGEGLVAHWIWEQPKYWRNRISNRAKFMKEEFSANYLVYQYMDDLEARAPRLPNHFVAKPMSHILVPTCGNSRCVRPGHQKWVTIQKYKELTACRGDNHGKVIMTKDKVEELYHMLDSGEYDLQNKGDIADKFGVKIDTIYSHRREWLRLRE